MYFDFPAHGLQLLSALVHFLGVTILTCFFACRLAAEHLSSRWGWQRLTWPHLCIILIMLDSYLFLFSTGLLIFGVGLEITEAACSAGIYLCVAFYTSSKVLIYAFLTEKVYIVWGNGRRRLRTPVCIVCFATVALYVAVVIALFFGRISHFRPSDGACVIGLRPTATISLLTYDLYINVLLTTLFLWPLLRNHVSNAGLKHVTIRTLVASTAALVTSTTNVSLLTALKGRELGWLCLMTSGIDVIVNASALFWATGGGSGTLAFVPPTDHGHPFEGRDGHEHSATNAAAAHRRRMPHMPHMPRIPHFNMPHFANPSTTKPAAVIGPMPYNLAHFTRSAPMPRPPAVPLEILIATTYDVNTSPPLQVVHHGRSHKVVLPAKIITDFEHKLSTDYESKTSADFGADFGSGNSDSPELFKRNSDFDLEKAAQ